MARIAYLRRLVIGLPLLSCSHAIMAQGTAQFPVSITLLPPPGCTGNSVPGSTTGSPQVTLTCGANLLVNVRPVLLSFDSGSNMAASNVAIDASTGTTGAAVSPGAAGGGAPISGRGNLPGGGMRFGPEAVPEGTSPQLIDGALFFYVIAAPPGTDSAGEGRWWRGLQTALATQAETWPRGPGKAMVMWLDF